MLFISVLRWFRICSFGFPLFVFHFISFYLNSHSSVHDIFGWSFYTHSSIIWFSLVSFSVFGITLIAVIHKHWQQCRWITCKHLFTYCETIGILSLSISLALSPSLSLIRSLCLLFVLYIVVFLLNIATYVHTHNPIYIYIYFHSYCCFFLALSKEPNKTFIESSWFHSGYCSYLMYHFFRRFWNSVSLSLSLTHFMPVFVCALHLFSVSHLSALC